MTDHPNLIQPGCDTLAGSMWELVVKGQRFSAEQIEKKLQLTKE
jgi:hypothetical protein